MKRSVGRWSTIVGILVAGSLSAQTPTTAEAPRFRDPVRLKAAEKLMGETRLYPSPVFHDENGDGRPDILIGDLIGKITVANMTTTNGAIAYGSEAPLKGADGKPLKFHNW